MKRLNMFIIAGAAALTFSSCNDFLSTIPKDALSPATTWKTETDALKFLTGCYDEWENGAWELYADCASDFGYANFPWEGFTNIGNGSMTPSDPGSINGSQIYDFTTIRKCNTFLENVEKCSFADEAVKKDMIAQVRAIRAYRYFMLGYLYGGVPIISNFTSAKEAQVPRNSEEDVKKYVFDELEKALADIKDKPSSRGYIAKGGVLAMKMRAALYWGDNKTANSVAKQIIDLGQYELDKSYADLFKPKGQNSKEIILAVQYVAGTKPIYEVGQEYPNGDGGWSSMVPTQNCVDNYEMANGKPISDPESGYDAKYPFYNRDPRMALTILYPGCEFGKRIYNTLDKQVDGENNVDYSTNADNATKTALSWRKYVDGEYAGGIWDANCCPIVFRYADVLLTWCETENELNGPSGQIYTYLNMIRKRVNMPKVDENVYSNKEKLRELIRRERGAELAGEGLRRADIQRWTGSDGQSIAMKVMNGPLTRITGTINYKETEPGKRAIINPDKREIIETRTYKVYNRYFPIPQNNIDNNPKLTQNEGYSK